MESGTGGSELPVAVDVRPWTINVALPYQCDISFCGIGDTLSFEGRGFTNIFSFTDDPSADYSDDTTLDRRGSPLLNRGQLSVVVESVMTAQLESPWIATLRARAPRQGPMKWEHVAQFITNATGLDGSAVRDGLAAQVLIVTDPMRMIRTLDISLSDSGRLNQSMASLLFLKPDRKRQASPDSNTPSHRFRDIVIDQTLEDSGLGLFCDHLASADYLELDGSVKSHGHLREATMSSFAGSVSKSLTKASQLASKATAVALPLLDPDHAGGARVQRAEMLASTARFGGMDHLVSREALSVIAERRLVVDRGHSNISDLARKMRDLAEIHSYGPYSADRERAYEAMLDQSQFAPASALGYVHEGSDREHVRLQVADVVAGWGRHLINSRGYVRLCEIFRCVLYNRDKLTLDLAHRLDEEITQHAAVIARLDNF